MSKRSPRLQFSDEEQSAPELKKAIHKAEKQSDKLDKAEAKIPKKTVQKKQFVVDADGKVTKHLHFEEVDKKAPPSKLSHAVKAAPVDTVLATAHREIRESEDENVGVEGAHSLEQTAEGGVRIVASAHHSHQLNFGDFDAASEKFKNKADADAALLAVNGDAVVKAVTNKEKSEKAPALYDLTTLQRDANRILGYTAQQTLDYVQSLYEKKLCTYPRTDSRYLTDDMENGLKEVVFCAAGICKAEAPGVAMLDQVCDSKKVTDHHAIIPTMVAAKTDLSKLPTGEREIMLLIARQVLRAVCEPYRFCETTVVISCGGYDFTVKGKSIRKAGWKAYNDKEQKDKALPVLSEGDKLSVVSSEVKEGKTKPPAHFTEDSLLSAMEVAGAKDMWSSWSCPNSVRWSPCCADPATISIKLPGESIPQTASITRISRRSSALRKSCGR